jgi:hypothetical protein
MEMWVGGIVAGDVMVTVTVTITSCDLVVCESGLPYYMQYIIPMIYVGNIHFWLSAFRFI